MSGHEAPAPYRLDLAPAQRVGYWCSVYHVRKAGALHLGGGWSLTRRGAIRRAQRLVNRHDRRAAKAARPHEYLWPRSDGK